MKAFDPYRILGISPQANLEEIRRAFREKARQLHPDLGGKKELFLELKRSYEFLCERLAPNRLRILKERPRGDNYLLSFLDVTARELALGATVTVVVPGKTKTCSHCQGRGQNPSGRKETCLFCEGRGEIEFSGAKRHLRIVCPRCGGEGVIWVDICPHCRGRGEVSGERELVLKLPLGARPGDILHLPPQEEDEVDVFFELQVHPSGNLVFEGRQLVSRAEVPFWSFALGCPLKVETLEGYERVALPPRFQPGTFFTLPNRGAYREDGTREDLMVRVEVVFPLDLSPAARKKLEEFAEIMEKKEGQNASSGY